MKEYLIKVQKFEEQNILVLVDDGRNRHFPTRNNIIKALRQLVAQSVSGGKWSYEFCFQTLHEFVVRLLAFSCIIQRASSTVELAKMNCIFLCHSVNIPFTLLVLFSYFGLQIPCTFIILVMVDY